MKIGFDYWHVCTRYPAYFQSLATLALAAGHEVYVVSVVSPDYPGSVRAEIAALGIPVTAVHQITFTKPGQSAQLKVSRCLELGIAVFYDTRDDVCRMLAARSVLAMRVILPDRRSRMSTAAQSGPDLMP